MQEIQPQGTTESSPSALSPITPPNLPSLDDLTTTTNKPSPLLNEDRFQQDRVPGTNLRKKLVTPMSNPMGVPSFVPFQPKLSTFQNAGRLRCLRRESSGATLLMRGSTLGWWRFTCTATAGGSFGAVALSLATRMSSRPPIAPEMPRSGRKSISRWGNVSNAQSLYPTSNRFRASQFTVRVGEWDLTDHDHYSEEYRVVDYTAHPNFRPNGFYNDVSVFKLDTPVTFSQ